MDLIKNQRSTQVCLYLLLLICILYPVGAQTKVQTTAEFVSSLGYRAENHFVASQGHILSVIRATNPKITKWTPGVKVPVLFIHPLWTNSKLYFARCPSADVPRDFSHMNLKKVGPKRIKKLLKQETSFSCLVAVLLNLGHEVWLLNRRSTRESLRHIKTNRQAFYEDDVQKNKTGQVGYLKVVTTSEPNPKFWNYSLDEQALHDLPSTIEYVLKETDSKKVSIVSLSDGGALVLMALSRLPELAEKSKLEPV